MSKKVPEGWKVSPLSKFCISVRGVSYRPDDLSDSRSEATVTLLRSNNIQDDSLTLSDVQYVKAARVKANQVAQRGDIAVCMSNGSKHLVGKNAVFSISDKNQKLTVGAFCSILRTTENGDHNFIKQLLKSDTYKKRVDSSLAGSAINNLKDSDMENYLFKFPPLPEQKKIASILTSVDEVIESTQKQIDKLQDLKKATMNELLTKGIGHTEFKDSELGRIPKNWETMKLDDFCVRVTDGTHDSPKRTHDGYRLVTSKNLKSGRLDLTDTYMISADDYREIEKRSKVDVNDILFGMIGTVGNPVIVSSYDLPFAIKNVALLKFGGDVNKSRWSFFYLDSELLRQRIKNDQTGSTQNFVGLGYMRNLRIPVPPISEMKGIVGIAEGIVSRLDNLQVKLLTLKSLKKSLMQDLLTGKVRVKVN